MTKALPTLKQRSDFLAMNKAERWVTKGFVIQYDPTLTCPPTIGYTVSKKVGNAVVRNRVKRRLRALSSEVLGSEMAKIVLIGRPGAQDIAFTTLVKDLRWALRRLKQRKARV